MKSVDLNMRSHDFELNSESHCRVPNAFGSVARLNKIVICLSHPQIKTVNKHFSLSWKAKTKTYSR